MNRERDLHGRNGYDRDLRFDPLARLRKVVERDGQATWLDLCCGTGTALAQAADICDRENLPIRIVGVDLAGMFVPYDSPRLQLVEASLSDWQPEEPFDLITCVHGLHYIGDKLNLILQAVRWLKPKGFFAGNLDLANVCLRDGRASHRVVASALRKAGFEYDYRRKLLSCYGRREVELPFRYLGADDQAGPNYTGQPAVNSWYKANA